MRKLNYFLVLLVAILAWYLINSHEQVQPLQSSIDVLLIGDSITDGWNDFSEKLSVYFGEKVVVHGIGGLDTLDLNTILLPTKNFRSRLSIPWWKSSEAVNWPFATMHFALKTYKPRVVVLEIGVNNWGRAFLGSNAEQYKVSRNYTKLDIEAIQEDAAVGHVNNRGVYQIIYQIKELYGEDTPIVLVGAFPAYYFPDPAVFNAFLEGFPEEKGDSILTHLFYLDPAPIARIGWSEEDGMFYDHNAFPAEKAPFDSIHVDGVHLNEKGYDIYAKMLECPVRQVLGEHNSVCSPVSAADMNAIMDE